MVKFKLPTIHAYNTFNGYLNMSLQRWNIQVWLVQALIIFEQSLHSYNIAILLNVQLIVINELDKAVDDQ